VLEAPSTGKVTLVARGPARNRVGLVGAGRGGSALLDLLSSWPEATVTVVIDRRQDTPGLEKARALGIPTASRASDVFGFPVDLVLEVTGDRAVLDDLLRAKPAGVEVIGAGGLRLFWDLLQDAVRGRREADLLAELARTVGESLDLDIVLQRIVQAAKDLCGSDMARIALREPGSDGLAVRYSVGASYDGYASLRIEPGKGAGGQVLLAGSPFRTERYLEDPRISKEYQAVARVEGIVADMVVPIRQGDRVEGLVYVDNRTPRAFTDRDEAVLLRLADHAAIVIRNAQLFAEAEHRQRAAESLGDLGRRVTQSLDLGDVAGRIAQSLQALLGTRASGVYRLVAGSGELAALAADGDVGPTFGENLVFPPGTGVVGLAVRARGPVTTPDCLEDPRVVLPPEIRRRIEQASYRAVLAVPLIVQDVVVGALAIGDRAGRVFTSEDIQLVQTFADQATVALENARLYQQVREAYEELSRTQAQLVQSQKIEAIGRLTGGIAHDFNNLLTVILVRTELALQSLKSEDPLRWTLELVHQTAGRAATLTHQLLAFSRKQRLEPRVLDLNAVVADIGQMLERLIGEQIRLVTALDPALGTVRADRGQLEQVIMNLVVNARDAMPEGGQLTLETANVELDAAFARRHLGSRPGPYVLSTVSDTGTGMSPDVQAHLFEPYFTTKGVGKGTGLGLATVHGIVKQSDGYISVYSEPGRGTTVKVYLPRVEAPAEQVEPAGPGAGAPRGSETILLVEDAEEVRALARDVLEAHGYAVLEAGHGVEALSVCETHSGPIQLVLTDVVMPEMGGRELAERLAGCRPEAKVLYMSGYTEHAIGRRGPLDARVPFIQKPFTSDVLARKVREVLDA
jgi:signal transduction histidine kinase